MKDSFIFEGKKYISSRRASGVSDYSSDYIGQLCRANKLECRMIGRTWFVSEESLHLHKASISRDEASRNRIENLRGGKAPSSVPIYPSASVASATDVVTEAIANASSNMEKITPVIPNMVSKVISAVTGIASGTGTGMTDAVAIASDAVIVPPIAWKVSNPSEKGFTYVADPRPLLPDLKVTSDAGVMDGKNVAGKSKSSNGKEVVVKSSDQNAKIISEVVSDVTKSQSTVIKAGLASAQNSRMKKFASVAGGMAGAVLGRMNLPSLSYPELTRSIILKRALASVAVLMFVVGLGVTTFNLVNNGSDSVATNSANQSKTNTASVVDTADSVLSSIRKGYMSVLAFFTSPAKIAIENKTPTKTFGEVTISDVTPDGIVLTSSEGTSVADEAVKQKIQGSFSDEVEVKPDKSGTAGVITPVFKESKGKDFIYVMVPVKDKGVSVTP